MSIEKKTLARLAELSRLDTESSDTIEGDLARILQLVDQIQAANTHDIEPLSHPLDVVQPLRKDIVTEENQRDLMLDLAPQAEAGLYLVPPVIENGE